MPYTLEPPAPEWYHHACQSQQAGLGHSVSPDKEPGVDKPPEGGGRVCPVGHLSRSWLQELAHSCNIDDACQAAASELCMMQGQIRLCSRLVHAAASQLPMAQHPSRLLRPCQTPELAGRALAAERRARLG